jgi:hypothetical protein
MAILSSSLAMRLIKVLDPRHPSESPLTFLRQLNPGFSLLFSVKVLQKSPTILACPLLL